MACQDIAVNFSLDNYIFGLDLGIHHAGRADKNITANFNRTFKPTLNMQILVTLDFTDDVKFFT